MNLNSYTFVTTIALCMEIIYAAIMVPVAFLSNSAYVPPSYFIDLFSLDRDTSDTVHACEWP